MFYNLLVLIDKVENQKKIRSKKEAVFFRVGVWAVVVEERKLVQKEMAFVLGRRRGPLRRSTAVLVEGHREKVASSQFIEGTGTKVAIVDFPVSHVLIKT
jgi:hypothetical protein